MGKMTRVRQRHLAVDLLAAGAGSFLVNAITARSWTSLIGFVVMAVGLYILDREGIENEEKSN